MPLQACLQRHVDVLLNIVHQVASYVPLPRQFFVACSEYATTMILKALSGAWHAASSLPVAFQLAAIGAIIALVYLFMKRFLKQQHHAQLPRGYRYA